LVPVAATLKTQTPPTGSVGPAVASGRRIRQKRSQKTYDALIATTFKLLEQREFDEISIAELAQTAGYSVGAFYARFNSKNELFDALVAQHLQDRTSARERIFASASDDTLIGELMAELVAYYWARRRFWRAALIRSIRDTDFWEPIRKKGHEFAALLIERLSARAGRALTKVEATNVRFAVQLALGTINNTMLNRPGPIFMDQALFVENLTRAFRLVSGYDEFVAARGPSKRAAARNRKPRRAKAPSARPGRTPLPA
jgi:AcrR family transcriptional regulator